MKTTNILLIALVMTAVISGGFTARAKPGSLSASFMADVNTGAAPLTVRFTDTSEGGPTGWHWDFGDGSSSTLQNPVYTFNTPGRYTVTLTVTDGERSDTLSGDIEVTNPLVTTPTPAPVKIIIRPVPVPVKDPHYGQPPHYRKPPAQQPPDDDRPPAIEPPRKDKPPVHKRPTATPTIKPDKPKRR